MLAHTNCRVQQHRTLEDLRKRSIPSCDAPRNTTVKAKCSRSSTLAVSRSDTSSVVVEVAAFDAAFMIGCNAFLMRFFRRLRCAAAASTRAAVISDGARSTEPNSPDIHWAMLGSGAALQTVQEIVAPMEDEDSCMSSQRSRVPIYRDNASHWKEATHVTRWTPPPMQ